MPNINLIALRRAEKKKIERLTRYLFMGFAGSVGGLVLLIVFLGGQQFLLKKQLSDARRELEKIQPELNLIKATEDATKSLVPKVTTLEQAKLGTLRYRNLFQVVSRSVPTSVWLGSLGSTGGEQDTTIALVGVSGSQSLVADLMTNLGKIPLFERIELKYTSLAGATDSVERIAFQVDARMKPPPAPDADTATTDAPTAIPPAAGAASLPAAPGTVGSLPRTTTNPIVPPAASQPTPAAPQQKPQQTAQGGQNGRS